MFGAVVLAGWIAAGAGAGPGLADSPDMAAYVKETPRCDAAVAHCFGLHLHVVATAEGPVQTVQWVSEHVTAANARFREIDVNFEIVAADALPAGDLEIDDKAERDALGDLRFTRGVAHVFVVGRLADVDIAGNEIRGVHWRFRKDRARRWVILSKIAGSLVLCHELGHFFGLPHSDYDISVMNKTVRLTPLLTELSFAEPEFARMRRHRDQMVRSGMLSRRTAQ